MERVRGRHAAGRIGAGGTLPRLRPSRPLAGSHHTRRHLHLRHWRCLPARSRLCLVRVTCFFTCLAKIYKLVIVRVSCDTSTDVSAAGDVFVDADGAVRVHGVLREGGINFAGAQRRHPYHRRHHAFAHGHRRSGDYLQESVLRSKYRCTMPIFELNLT